MTLDNPLDNQRILVTARAAPLPQPCGAAN
jgi:hypothetical protein